MATDRLDLPGNGATEKERERAQLAADVAEYLRRGGSIETLGSGETVTERPETRRPYAPPVRVDSTF